MQENIYRTLKFKNVLKHLYTILKHKWYVGIECFKLGLYWQGIVHDLSKFHPIEFIESARFFSNGTYSPIDDIKKQYGYSKAWIHHKSSNKHHWQYWVDYKTGVPFSVGIPQKYLKEMFCDMVGASKTYKDSNAYEYFKNNSFYWIMTPGNKTYLDLLFKIHYNK
jgi:hypothetical protein